MQIGHTQYAAGVLRVAQTLHFARRIALGSPELLQCHLMKSEKGSSAAFEAAGLGPSGGASGSGLLWGGRARLFWGTSSASGQQYGPELSAQQQRRRKPSPLGRRQDRPPHEEVQNLWADVLCRRRGQYLWQDEDHQDPAPAMTRRLHLGARHLDLPRRHPLQVQPRGLLRRQAPSGQTASTTSPEGAAGTAKIWVLSSWAERPH